MIPVINREISLAGNAGALVVFTQDWHPEHTPHFAKDGGIWPDHCVQDTWGAAFHPDLDVPADAQIVHKGANGEDGYSAFTMRDPSSGETIPTELTSILRAARDPRRGDHGPGDRLLREGDRARCPSGSASCPPS